MFFNILAVPKVFETCDGFVYVLLSSFLGVTRVERDKSDRYGTNFFVVGVTDQ